MGDLYFVNNIHEVLNIQMEQISPIYFYKFSYRSDYPGIKKRLNLKIDSMYLNL
jgi:hypothetical protein